MKIAHYLGWHRLNVAKNTVISLVLQEWDARWRMKTQMLGQSSFSSTYWQETYNKICKWMSVFRAKCLHSEFLKFLEVIHGRNHVYRFNTFLANLAEVFGPRGRVIFNSDSSCGPLLFFSHIWIQKGTIKVNCSDLAENLVWLKKYSILAFCLQCFMVNKLWINLATNAAWQRHLNVKQICHQTLFSHEHSNHKINHL